MTNTTATEHPRIIQGGMGAGVSCWTLARVVSQRGQLGVVSGTALDQMITRRLQVGDPGGHMRRAIESFPYPDIAEMVLSKYYVAGGKDPNKPFRLPSMIRIAMPRELAQTLVLSNYVEVWLAKEGHDGIVGINLLDKIQLPNLASLYGAMLAKVDYVLMGAGIPYQIPGALDAFARGEAASMKVTLEDDPEAIGAELVFDPADALQATPPPLPRPKFLGIISTATVAMALVKRAKGKVDGFVVEGWTAGGHNAPPRGKVQLNEIGEPIYGERDDPQLDKLKTLGAPFWLAGGMGRPGQLAHAISLGAEGIQVGTAFAMSRESGLSDESRAQILSLVAEGKGGVFTDPRASPTGFPFKVVQVGGTISEKETYEARNRVCDLGYLRRAYRKEDGTVGYRCPSEPVDDYLKKGGDVEDTDGRKCLCNGLMATIGLGQSRRHGEYHELPIYTAGDDLAMVRDFLGEGRTSYSATDVLDRLLSEG